MTCARVSAPLGTLGKGSVSHKIPPHRHAPLSVICVRRSPRSFAAQTPLVCLAVCTTTNTTMYKYIGYSPSASSSNDTDRSTRCAVVLSRVGFAGSDPIAYGRIRGRIEGAGKEGVVSDGIRERHQDGCSEGHVVSSMRDGH